MTWLRLASPQQLRRWCLRQQVCDWAAFSDLNHGGECHDLCSERVSGWSARTDAGKLVDQFIQTQNDGKIVVAEYAANIGKVASAAAGLGVPLSEVNAVIAQATASGVQAKLHSLA